MAGISLNFQKLTPNSIKFLCSYGGRILPRYPDGKLRYNGGEARVLSVDRTISFSELLVKLGELCGTAVNLRCQLPTEDLDALVSITCDEDLANLIEEYDMTAAAPSSPSSIKIRAFLCGPKNIKKVSPPQSLTSSSSDTTSPTAPFYTAAVPPRYPTSVTGRCVRQMSRQLAYPILNEKVGGKIRRHPNCGHVYLIQSLGNSKKDLVNVIN